MLSPHRFVGLISILVLANAISPHNTKCSQAKVTAFWVVEFNPYLRVRELISNSVFTALGDYTVIADVSVNFCVRSDTVTFMQPFRRITSSPFYTLTSVCYGATKSCQESLKLQKGVYSFSAFPGSNPLGALTITNVTIIPPPLPPPKRGPKPTEIKPEASEKNVKAPRLLSKCKGKLHAVPKLSSNAEWTTFGDRSLVPPYTLRAQIKSCQNEIRIRGMEYIPTSLRNGMVLVKTRVLEAKIPDYYSYYASITFENDQCRERRVFMEVCVSDAKGRELCDTTKIHTLPAGIVSEPRLVFRPPIRLVLAPGDRASIATETTRWFYEDAIFDGFYNGQYAKNGSYILQSIVERPDGSLQSSPEIVGDKVTVSVPFGKQSITKRDNGTRVYLQYRSPQCPERVQSFREPYYTEIIVDSKISPLVRQDTKIPDFDTPTFPKTTYLKSANITVHAVNNGGGRRRDGTKTELTYQWYWRDVVGLDEPRYLKPIKGATGKTLHISHVFCLSFHSCSFSPFSCEGLAIYHVDVCNTYGCRRSDAIIPNVRPPKDGHDRLNFFSFCT